MRTKYITIIITAAMIVTGLSGCSLLRKRVEKTEKVEFKLSAVNKTKLSLDDSNGDIKITKTNDSTNVIVINAVKSYNVRWDEKDKPIDMVRINIDSAGSEVKITTEIERNNGLFKRNKGGKVDYNIKVPAGMDVEIDNTNGDITLVNLDGRIDIETVNSAINLANCTGSIKIDGVNGGVNGNFDSTKGVNIELVNGIVKLGGLKNINADVNVSTTNGRVKSKNLQFTNMESERRSLTGILGKGGSTISVTTVNGAITLNAERVNYKKDIDINFKIDFDGDEKIRIIENEHDGIDIEFDDEHDNNETNPRGNNADTNKTNTDKRADSLKNK